MSRCDLEVVLERPDGRYVAGEVVTGFVSVRANAECVCNGLDVWVGWRTHGRGNRRTAEFGRTRLFTGTWKADEEQIHPFELQLPADAPPTYEGTVLNLDWDVHATADIPWAFDPTAGAPLHVSAAPDGAHDPGPTFGTLVQTQAAASRAMLIFAGFWFLLTVPILGTMTVLSVTEAASALEAVGALAFVSLFDVVFLGLGGFLVYKALGSRMAERRLGPVEVTLPDRPLRPGEAIPVEVGFSPTTALQGSVTATLRGQEIVVSGSGTNRKTYTQELHLDRRVLQEHGPLGTQRVSLRVDLPVPPDAAPSFEADDNALRWEVTVDVAIAGWPDWTRTQVVHVAPATR